ncbi:hypothetical protein [Bosea sp. WAO]|uniref:hypothetical protein n=1 Tax=Bosea sp. WAO TaxID=406341 RepID=UPI00082C72AE|nr:hypothetical protein [Bosea sp. WAO]
MRASDHRKHIPVGAKLHACLLLLGYTEEQIPHLQWDHEPALGLRAIDAETGEMTPAPNDPRFIRPMLPDDHAVKTRGAGATTAGSDVGKMKKLRKLVAKEAAFRERVLAKGGQASAPMTKKQRRAWPSRAFPNRKRRTS